MEQQQQEEEHHQWVALEEEEEMEETNLRGRKSLQHLKDNVITSVAGSSSSSSPTIQKEEEITDTVTEMGYVSENKHHCTDEEEEVEDAVTNVEAITATTTTTSDALQNRSSVYFDDQEDIQNALINDVTNQYMKTVEYKGQFGSVSSPSHGSSEVYLNGEISTKADPDLIEDFDQRLRELDVEAVLAKQETHDLFCPNCNSCITKRVILRKRKRSIQSLEPKAKRDKFETIVSSKRADASAYEANQGDHTITTYDVGSAEPPADSYNHEREPEVFRCLSCFSYFIPTGNGFNLFRKFSGTREQETSQNSSSIPAFNLQDPSRLPVSDVKNPSNIQASNANWFFSLFTSNKGTKASKQVDASFRHSAELNHSSSTITSNMLASSEIGHPEGSSLTDTTIIQNGKPFPDIIKLKHGRVEVESQIEEDFKSNMASGNESLADQNESSSLQTCTQTVGNVMNQLQEVERDLKDSSAKEHILTGNFREIKDDTVDVKKTDSAASMNLPGDMILKHGRVLLATAITSEAVAEAVEPAKDPTLKPYEGESDFSVPSNVGCLILENSEDIYKTSNMAIEDKLIVQNSYSPSMQGSEVPAQSFCSAELATDAITDIESSGGDKYLPEQDLRLVEQVKEEIEEEIDPTVRNEKKGSDVIVFVEAEAVTSKIFQTEDSGPIKGAILTETSTQTQVYIGEQAGDEVGEPYGWEILKSIVYGGLVESITSLGIVTSAASAGSSPLNIIALGLANLVGGLFIIGHNLIELKNDDSGGDPQQMNKQGDRYQKLLGRRVNFVLHAVVVVLSFLILGSVPLVIYGILSRENYSSEVNVAAVAATSVVCIILLAVAKVYTRRPPKSYIKTVLYYVTLALATTGVSYVVGGLVKDLIEKLSHRESGFVIAMPFSDTMKTKPAWTSY